MITPRTAQFAPYRAVLASRVRSQRSYRTNFALDLASSALIGFIELAEIWVLFHNVGSLGGYSFKQILLVYGIADLVERAEATIKTVEKLFREHWPTSAAVYLPNGKVPEAGSLFTNKTMAATYTRVLKEAESAGADRVAQIEKARKVWSQGFVAEAIDKFCRTQAVMDTSGKKHLGVLTGQDMAKWQATLDAPLTYDYGRYTVCKASWSQGPVTLQQLALLKGFNLDGMDVVGPDFIHLVVECSKLAYADREKFYGDPNFVEVPFETLLSDAYNAERRKLVTDKASMELRPGSVEGFGARRRRFGDGRPSSAAR